MKRIAIMQPTYLPWSGYFGLMTLVDTFVILDDVQFAKRSWQQRNQIKTSSGALWLTVPVESKGKRDQLIKDVKIKHTVDFSNSHTKSILHSYRKTPHFDEYSANLMAIIESKFDNLIDLNMEIIKYLGRQIKIDCNFVFSSQLQSKGSKAALLASICQQLKADEYISPPGSSIYLDGSMEFKTIGVPVHYFKFEHPIYNQPFGDFLSHLSFIDMLFSCGSTKTAMLIREASSITNHA